VEPLLSHTKQILGKCDFLDSTECGVGQSAEAVQFKQLASRYSDVTARVANLTDQLMRASVEREELCVCYLADYLSKLTLYAMSADEES